MTAFGHNGGWRASGPRFNDGGSTRRVRVALAAFACVVALSGCQKIETFLFTRNSPEVDKAVRAIETRDAGDAHQLLADYLSTGRCRAGTLGTPDTVREREKASLDLGLALFQIAERYGQKFGEHPEATQEAQAAASPALAKRSQHVDCAQRVVRVIAQDKDLPVLLRAQAFYLSGNLDFLRHDYESAVASYDSALLLVPGGSSDAGEGIGTKAAWNRSIALRRIEDEKEDEPPKPDAGTSESQDGGAPKQDDSQEQDEDSQKQDENQEQEPKEEPSDEQKPDEKDPSQDSQQQDQQEQDSQQAKQQPEDKRPSLSQDEQILQMLERAPMLQQELPKTQGRVRGRPPMEDK